MSVLLYVYGGGALLFVALSILLGGLRGFRDALVVLGIGVFWPVVLIWSIGQAFRDAETS